MRLKRPYSKSWGTLPIKYGTAEFNRDRINILYDDRPGRPKEVLFPK